MQWSTSRLGKKYWDKTLPQIMFIDPDWFYWAYSNKKFRDYLRPEANEVFRKSRSIKVPQNCKSLGVPLDSDYTCVAEYTFDPESGRFLFLEIVPDILPPYAGSIPMFRKHVIDMSVPHKNYPYDKIGNNRLIRRLKHYLFGDSNFRITKGRCEEFFSNNDNFVL